MNSKSFYKICLTDQHKLLDKSLRYLLNSSKEEIKTFYRDLLPECSVNGEVYQWEEKEIRGRDWSENEHFA